MNNIMAVWKKRRRIKRRQPTQHIQITSLHSSSSSPPPSSQTVSWLLSSHLVGSSTSTSINHNRLYQHTHTQAEAGLAYRDCLSLQLSGVFFLFSFSFFKATSRLHWLVKCSDVTPDQPPYWWMVGQPGWKQLCCCVAAHCKSGLKVNIESSSKPESRRERTREKRL